MAASNPTTETDICNIALGGIGAKQITSTQFDDTDTTNVQAIQCQLHYAQTRDALIRSHWWRFAKARAALVATTTPAFEWAYAFTLPTDFLLEKSVYEDNNSIKENTIYSYELEGNLLLTDESSCNLRYIKQVTAVTSFEPLFIEALVLQLELKLCMPLTQDVKLKESIKDDIKRIMPRILMIDRREESRIGRGERILWNNSRSANFGRIDSKLGSN
jgi:hypothetical protein